MTQTSERMLQEAFVLHQRPYRETSLIVELFTRVHGRISVIARGVKRTKRNKKQAPLQPFVPLWVAWSGKGSLPTLSIVEINERHIELSPRALLCGLYLNELLMRVLHRFEAHETLFDGYHHALLQLEENSLNEPIILLRFESILLRELGYAVPLTYEARTKQWIEGKYYYRYVPEEGFVLLPVGKSLPNHPAVFSGEHLLLIAKQDYEQIAVRLAAKRLFQLALTPLLGGRVLHSLALLKK